VHQTLEQSAEQETRPNFGTVELLTPRWTDMPYLFDSPSTVVAIAGGSASGKTTLAEYLAQDVGSNFATVLTMDRFYLSKPARLKSGLTNFDHPLVIDFPLLMHVIRTLRCGSSVSVPIYDYARHDRIGFETLPGSKLIIFEGILALWHQEIRRHIDFGVYVKTPANVRLNRRLERDVRERGRDYQSIKSQWAESVMPMHEQHVAPTKRYADKVINGKYRLDKTAKLLSKQLGLSRKLQGVEGKITPAETLVRIPACQ
jgi:uridine kinase